MCLPLVEIIHSSFDEGPTTSSLEVRAAPRGARWRDGESWPSDDGKAFYFEEARVRKPSYYQSGIRMHYAAAVWSPPLPSFPPSFGSTLSLSPSPCLSFHFYSLSFGAKHRSRLYRRRNATREDLERRIFRDTKGERFTAKWIDYSVSRSRQRREERRLLARARARAGRREQCSTAHLRFCLDERMEIALL